MWLIVTLVIFNCDTGLFYHVSHQTHSQVVTMTFKAKKVQSQKSYSKEDIVKAQHLIENGWTVKRAAAAYNIPRSTLILHLRGWKNRRRVVNENVGSPVELKEETERHLSESLHTMSK